MSHAFTFNTGVMNPPEPFVFPGHSTGQWSMAVAAFCVGGPFGSVLGGQWAASRGRRGALLIIMWLFILGGVLNAVAPSVNILSLSRGIIGLASGASSVVVPLYLGEMAPPNLRGVLGTMTQFALVIGIFAVDLVGFVFANADQWRYMFALTAVFAVLQLALTPFLLESPRWLLGRNRNSAKARFIIKKLRGFRYDEEVETEVDHFIGAAKSQHLECGDEDDYDGPADDLKKPKKDSAAGSVTAEMFADKKVRLLVISTLVLQAAQQLCG
jgi:SP family facilitated glucose transporter-like MFS transporter 3